MALSRALSLTRFITKGPVTKLSSTPYPNYWSRDVWHSIAQLPAEWFSGNKTLRFMSYAAGAWSKNKEESQIKALVEAGERWAFWYYSKNSPSAAGINIDASTNGFAALPSSMGIQKTMEIALCEAIERWLLNNIWNTSLVGLTPINYEAGIVKKFSPMPVKSCFFFKHH